MNKVAFFVGVDISKHHLDFCIVQDGKIINFSKIENQTSAIKKYLKELISLKQVRYDNAIFCMEYTGIYNNHLVKFLTGNNALIWLENPTHLKRSLGLVRGKSDKVDAERIALYAYKNRDNVKLWKPERKIISTLKQLLMCRQRILKAIESLKKPISEAKQFVDKETLNHIKKACNASLNALQKDLKNIDNKILETINLDERIKELFTIVTSVDNVGMIVATAVIVVTNEFKKFTDPKKFACYAGIAPFEHTSGISIKGKMQVSFMANKYMKKLLHLSAVGAISRPGELRDYFDRKLLEGKNKMVILNAIRNKIILRIFVCVNQNKMFEKNYKKNLQLA